MLPYLLFLLLRRYQQKHPGQTRLFFTRFPLVLRVTLLLLLTAGIALYVFSQERVLQYTIRRSGAAVGNMIVKEDKNSNGITYKMWSTVKTSFLFTIIVKAIEEATYENGVLTYSHSYQKVNSSERLNTEIQANGKGYTVISKQDVKPFTSYPITYNMICLYTMEPLHMARLFVDKSQQFVPIESLGRHHYKITFPDGNSNEYFYEDGICTTVKLYGTWYNAEMELKR